MNISEAYLEVSLRIPIDDVKVRQRLDRAYGILNDYGYDIVTHEALPGVGQYYTVKKASTTLLEDTSAQYTVSHEDCTCPDYPTARGGLCKHRLAVMMLEEMNK